MQVLKEKWLKIAGFAHSQTTNKLVNKAANDSARVSGQDRKKLPTNQIAGFGGFRPLASLEKTRRCGSVYLGVAVLRVREVFLCVLGICE